MRRVQRGSGSLLGVLILADLHPDHVVPGAEILGVAPGLVGVVAEDVLEAPDEAAGPPVLITVDVDPRQSLRAVQDVAVIGPEAGRLQSLTGVLERRVVGERAHHAPLRIRERVVCVCVAGHAHTFPRQEVARLIPNG